MDAKLGQGFNPCKILELIRLWLQPVFVWEDRWVLRSLPLAAVAGITGQALMGSGIASCCISNNEQWQALHSHNKSQATLETLKTRLGACFLFSAVSLLTNRLTRWLAAAYLYHSFTDAALYRTQSTPFRYSRTLVSMYSCPSGILGSYWLLYRCCAFLNNYYCCRNNINSQSIYSRDEEVCGLGFVESYIQGLILKQEKM